MNNKKIKNKAIKSVSVKSAVPVREKWSPEEDETLLSFTGTTKELADVLGRSVKSVTARRARLRNKGNDKLEYKEKAGRKSSIKSEDKKGSAMSESDCFSEAAEMVNIMPILDLKTGDVFMLPNGKSYICNSIPEPQIRESKIYFEFIGTNTVRYMCIIPENFGFAKKSLYSKEELKSLKCKYLFNVWDTATAK